MAKKDEEAAIPAMWGWRCTVVRGLRTAALGQGSRWTGAEELLQVGVVPIFCGPHCSILPSSPSPKGQYPVFWACLPSQSGLLSSAMMNGGPRALWQCGLLAGVPGVGALCPVGEDTVAGRDGAGLPQGQANPVHPVLKAQPFGLPPAPCPNFAPPWREERHLSEWPVN